MKRQRVAPRLARHGPGMKRKSSPRRVSPARDRAHQAFGVGWSGSPRWRPARHLDDLATIHDGDPARDAGDDAQVVRDQDQPDPVSRWIGKEVENPRRRLHRGRSSARRDDQLGSHRDAMAIMTAGAGRRELAGVRVRRSSGDELPTRPRSSSACRRAAFRRDGPVLAQHLRHLVADTVARSSAVIGPGRSWQCARRGACARPPRRVRRHRPPRAIASAVRRAGRGRGPSWRARSGSCRSPISPTIASVSPAATGEVDAAHGPGRPARQRDLDPQAAHLEERRRCHAAPPPRSRRARRRQGG